MERKILHKAYLLRLPRNMIAVTYLALTSATDLIVIVELIAPYLPDSVGKVANQTSQLPPHRLSAQNGHGKTMHN